MCRPLSSADADLEERLARDKALQRATAVSQRVGRLLLKAESGELALVDQLAQELLESEYRRAQSCPARASARLSWKRLALRHKACSAPGFLSSTLVVVAAPDHGHLEGSEQSVCLACSAPAKAVLCEGERGDCLQCYREHGQARHRP